MIIYHYEPLLSINGITVPLLDRSHFHVDLIPTVLSTSIAIPHLSVSSAWNRNSDRLHLSKRTAGTDVSCKGHCPLVMA
jgi:hypothetical protein